MKQSHLPFALLVVLILAWQLFTAQALAQWSTDPNLNNAISTAVNDQQQPATVSDGAGGAIITWHDSRSGNFDIYAQRISASGDTVWTADGVAISTATSIQQYPAIVSDGVGGAIITWEDFRSSGTAYDIYAQRIDANGVVQWTADGVAICTAADYQIRPTVVSDGAEGAIITWEDFRSIGTMGVDIYAQRIDANGVVQWTADGVAISTAVDNQQKPTITSDGAGGAIVTWQDFRSGSSFDTYAQRITASGNVWIANGVAISTAAYQQTSPYIVSDGAGGAIITWEDSRSGSSVDIYAQRITATGDTVWTADGVAISTAANNQIFSSGGVQRAPITSDGAGGAIITWEDLRGDVLNANIYAQRINASGDTVWTGDGVAISTAVNAQNQSTIVSDGAGGAIITWNDSRSFATAGADIYAQRINGSGAVQWTADGVAISTAANNQQYPTIVSDGAGGAIITWEDLRGNFDIYAQQVSANGQLGGVTGASNLPPAAPQNLVITDSSSGTISLRWSKNTEPDFLLYRIYRATTPAPTTQVDSTTGGAADTAKTFTGLSDGTRYYFRVTALDSAGNESAFSNEVDAVPADRIAPSAPQNLVVTDSSSGTIGIRWRKNSENDFLRYRIYRETTPAPVTQVDSTTGGISDTSKTFTGLTNGTRYYLRVTAVDSAGNESAYSNEVNAAPNVALSAEDLFAFVPTEYSLSQNYPNPFNPGTVIRYGLPEGSFVTLTVFDLLGKTVATLVHADQEARFYEVYWQADVPSGIYFYRLVAVSKNQGKRVFQQDRKMILLR